MPPKSVKKSPNRSNVTGKFAKFIDANRTFQAEPSKLKEVRDSPEYQDFRRRLHGLIDRKMPSRPKPGSRVIPQNFEGAFPQGMKVPAWMVPEKGARIFDIRRALFSREHDFVNVRDVGSWDSIHKPRKPMFSSGRLVVRPNRMELYEKNPKGKLTEKPLFSWKIKGGKLGRLEY